MERMKKTRGQVVLIVLLIMAVALTVGLSLASRTVTDIKISRQEEESARAFSAAEAGVEELLKPGAGLVAEGSFEEGGQFKAEAKVASGLKEFVFPSSVTPSTWQTLWLVEHQSDGSLKEEPFYQAESLELCWQKTVPETAIEVAIFYKEGGSYKVARGAYDFEAESRGNGFALPDSGGCAGLERRKRLTWRDFGINLGVNTFLLFLRLRPIYNQTKIGVVAQGGEGGLLPSQGKEIVSTGKTGGITRKVRFFRSWPVPPFGDYLLYSGEELTK